MTKIIKKVSLESEIDGRFRTANSLFGQGVDIGAKSFEQLITISSAALGLLLTYRSGLLTGGTTRSLGLIESILWIVITFGFSFTILSSVRRNYYAGQGLVSRAHYIRSRAHRKLDPTNEDFIRNERAARLLIDESERHRKKWSFIARFAFYWAIVPMLIFIASEEIASILEFFLGFVEGHQIIFWILTALIGILGNIILSVMFALSPEKPANDQKQALNGGRCKT